MTPRKTGLGSRTEPRSQYRRDDGDRAAFAEGEQGLAPRLVKHAAAGDDRGARAFAKAAAMSSGSSEGAGGGKGIVPSSASASCTSIGKVRWTGPRGCCVAACSASSMPPASGRAGPPCAHTCTGERRSGAGPCPGNVRGLRLPWQRAADEQHGGTVEPGIRNSRQRVDVGHAARHGAHTRTAGQPSICFRDISGRLLVTRIDKPDPARARRLEEGVEPMAAQSRNPVHPCRRRDVMRIPPQSFARYHTLRNQRMCRATSSKPSDAYNSLALRLLVRQSRLTYCAPSDFR